MKKGSIIWIWMHNDKLLKAVLIEHEGSLSMYDDEDQLIFTRKGLTPEDVRSVKYLLSMIGAKRIDDKKEPFVYL